MNPVMRTTIAIAIAAALTGCATQDGKFNHLMTSNGKCLTCINNPITGKPLNHDGPGVAPLGSPEAKEQMKQNQDQVKSIAADQPAQYDIHKRVFMVAKNVDVAYIRVKHEFNFYSLEEVQAEHGRSAWEIIQSPTWKYDALLSVFYKMRGYRQHNGTELTIDTEIEKRTDSTSQITLRYWLPAGTSDYNKKLYGDGLQERIIKSINS
ncbi:MAG: hypothetical protein ACJAWL_002957 [Motiliproteus sp.]|jgi:hypothetical protein